MKCQVYELRLTTKGLQTPERLCKYTNFKLILNPKMSTLSVEGDANNLANQDLHFAVGAQALLKAFENFVVPLVKKNTKQDLLTSQSGSTIESQEFLTALTRYIGSLVCTSSSSTRNEDITMQKDDGVAVPMIPLPNERDANVEDRKKSNDTKQITEVTHARSSSLSAGVSEQMEEYQRKIQIHLEEARHIVFNKMPIRLLMFNENGTDIRPRLVERSEVFRRISLDFEKHAQTFNSLDFDTFSFSRYKYTAYSILSHTWLQSAPGEVTYVDWKKESYDLTSPGYVKLQKFCEVAANDYGIILGWMDTVCINKENSTELDESIRSMYKWYEGSQVCLVYLADTIQVEAMQSDKWFTRGWTLQELISPRYVNFFNSNWKRMVPKTSTGITNDLTGTSLVPDICKATGISDEELRTVSRSSSESGLSTIPIWRRMQWAASRNVTREEDTAYSLMGIFNVSISTAYGEGAERAFFRLVREILNSRTPRVLEVANWGYGRASVHLHQSTAISPSTLIPPGPKFYMHAAPTVQWKPPQTPITLSHLGLCVTMLLMPSVGIAQTGWSDTASESKLVPMGRYSAKVDGVGIMNDSVSEYQPDQPDRRLPVKYYNFKVLERAIFDVFDGPGLAVSVFAVLNIVETPTEVILPEGPCFAALDWFPSPPLRLGRFSEEYKFTKTPTENLITFDLRREGSNPLQIRKVDLARMGMTLRTFHL